MDRIERALERFPERFPARICSNAERARCERRGPRHQGARFAQHFAAKEACAKALGTGFRRGVFWRDMEVCPLDSGQPMLYLKHGARARVLELLPRGFKAWCDLSLSDEAGLASAVVVLWASEYASPVNPYVYTHP